MNRKVTRRDFIAGSVAGAGLVSLGAANLEAATDPKSKMPLRPLGKTGRMVSLLDGKITSIPIKDVTGKLYRVDVATEYDTERYNGRRKILR